MKILPMNKLLSIISILICLLLPIFGMAQQRDDADFMRSMGKIYVVLAVILVIFLGIVTFLIFLDRKLTKLENQLFQDDQI